MIDQEYQYFKKNKSSLIKKYLGKYILISSESLKGVFDDEKDAYDEGVEKFGLGKFIVQQCISDSENIQSFHSRVQF